MRRHFVTAVTLGAIALTACSDSSLDPTLQGNATPEDQTEITQLLEESGFFADEFGVDGLVLGAAAEQSAGIFGSPGEIQGEVPLPERWGRHHKRPVRRSITIEVDEIEGIAWVTKRVVFEGEFVFATATDLGPEATRKPMQHTLIQSARFERATDDGVGDPPPQEPKDEPPTGSPQDGDRHQRRWCLVAISPAQWVMTEPIEQRVEIGKVVVYVDDEPVLEVTNPNELYEVDGRVPHLAEGQVMTVRAWVEGGTLDNDPSRYVFLHWQHRSPDTRIWMRRQMEFVDGDDPHYVRSWEVLAAGRERIAVDLIDSQSFAVTDEDDYNANVWGIPYIIE